jgi:hypothetical protein
MRKLIKTLAFCALLAFTSPAYSQHLHIRIAPPKLRVEVVPPAVTGQVWIPGYYNFDASINNYVWVPGHYEAPPAPERTWVEPRYERHHGDYIYVPGHWK